MAGYVRPRITDKQARVLQLVLDRELAAGYRRHESVILARVQKAVDDAFTQREERRERRRARDEALSRRGVLSRTFRRREGRPF
jgi:hypothetical protein